MRILNITSEFREGFAVAASLSLRGHRVINVQLGSRFIVDKAELQLDTGSVTISFIEVPAISLRRYIGTLHRLLIEKISDLDFVMTSPCSWCFPLARHISKVYQVPLILRVSDLGTIGKFREAIKLFHYYRIVPDLPLSFVRLYKSLINSDVVIAHTNLISKILEHYLLRNNLLIYPTYARVITRASTIISTIIDEILTSPSERDVVLGISMVSRPGLAGKHDRKAFECLYKIAKYNPDNLTVIVIGTGYKEAQMVLEKNTFPSNLKLLGIINNDFILEQIYKISSLVVVPFFFSKTISNRLLETLFYGRPALISSYLKEDFPMLKHGENVLMFDECNKLPYLVRYLFKSDLLKRLEEGAKKNMERSVFG